MRAIVFGSVVALAAATASAAPINSIFNPNDYAAADGSGGLTLVAGDTVTFNTATGDVTGSVSFVGAGVAANNASGLVAARVFPFSSINIPAGVTVNVTGDRALVLLSKSNFTFGSTLSVSGVNVLDNATAGGAGGPGAEGGPRNGSTSSAPPVNGGLGGTGVSGAATAGAVGTGVGGGGIGSDNAQRPGGGASYAGSGGAGGNSGGTAGNTYGDAALVNLFGGSGGGAGRHSNTATEPMGGGGGGGAVELVALNTLTVTGSLLAEGGNGGGGLGTEFHVGGGGGSGGGVLLAADVLSFSGTVDVTGGDGGNVFNAVRGGGAGGGGRVALYSNSLINTGSFLLAGGTASDGGAAGGAGTSSLNTLGQFPVPEPSAALFCGAAACAAGLSRRRRRTPADRAGR